MAKGASKVPKMMIALAIVVSLSVGYALFKRSQSRLMELDSVDELRVRFNQDRGKPRLVLLLSPT